MLRLAEQSRRHSQTLLHAQRIAADLVLRRLGHTDLLEALLHAGVGDAGAAGEGPQMSAARTSLVVPRRIQNRAGDAGLILQRGKGLVAVGVALRIRPGEQGLARENLSLHRRER